jgi:putative glutathione S-transferase
MRRLKGLEDILSVSVVHWHMRELGWTFSPGPCVTGDPVNSAQTLYEVYLAADQRYTGRVTVPVLLDKERQTIVSNESAEILRMFNSAFDGVGAAPGDYYPKQLRADIDALNERIYRDVNNGVYRAGFATTQEAYEEAVRSLFETLDWLESGLSRSRYLLGDQLNEADIRLFTTLVRFDAVYHGHFKCNIRRIVDYPALWRFTRDIYNLKGVAETVNMHHIRHHYYESHRTINPSGIVPAGPALDFSISADQLSKVAA